MKILVLSRELQKFVVIINVLLGAIAEDKPELLALVARVIGQQPMEHRAKRGDAGAGGNENRIAHRRAQDEIAEWTLAADRITFLHVAKKGGHESVQYTVETEREVRVL